MGTTSDTSFNLGNRKTAKETNMNKIRLTIAAMGMALVLLPSCVSKKKYRGLLGDYDQIKILYQSSQKDAEFCEKELLSAKKQIEENAKLIARLEEELNFLKNTNTNLLTQMSDLQVVTKAGAESIKKSLEVLDQQNKYIKDLNEGIQRKDSINLVLASNLKRSLADVNDEDVQIEVKGGVVYVSLSDKLLFRTASAVINPAAKQILEKIASIVKDHNELDVMVQGHTDNVPISSDCVADNWDLSAKRANAVVRMLQNDFSIKPSRLVAAACGEYRPKAENKDVKGRSMNRRTEILLTPRFDQFFELLVPQEKP